MARHTGAVYYITTLDEWYKQVGQFVESHYVTLDRSVLVPEPPPYTDPIPVCVVVVAHEATHAQLEAHPAWEALPHPLSGNPVKQEHLDTFQGHPGIDQQRQKQQALAPGQSLKLNTFQLATALAQSHPLLGWRIF